MTRPRIVHAATRDLIEQGIARGDRPAYIAQRLNVPVDAVLSVEGDMEALIRQFDQPTTPPAPKPPKPCGTAAAAKRHRRKGQPLCEACRAAEREAHVLYRGGAPDEVAITEAVAGRRPTLTHAERAEAIRRMTEAGYSSTQIAARLGTTRRTVVRRRTAQRRKDAA